METIRVNNKFKNVIYSKVFHCCSIILIIPHNFKVNDIINIQLVNPVKGIQNKKVKVYGISKIKNRLIDKNCSIYAVEQITMWQLSEYFDRDDELTIIHIEDVKDEKWK